MRRVANAGPLTLPAAGGYEDRSQLLLFHKLRLGMLQGVDDRRFPLLCDMARR